MVRGYGTPFVHSLNRNLARTDWVKALRKFELFHAPMTLQTHALLGTLEFGGRKPTPNKNPFLFGWARFLIGPETIKLAERICSRLAQPDWTARSAGGSSTA